MPHSLRDNDECVRSYVKEHGIKSMLDIGAGSGTYGHLLRDLVPDRIAVEIWAPYVEEFGLRRVYGSVIVMDVRELASLGRVSLPKLDLLVLGDVLEHMTLDEGKRVWEWAKGEAHHVLLSVPIVHWPQEAIDGNPYEEHVQDCITVEDYREHFGPFTSEHIYAQTATFFVECQ